jgi:uncharacterized protein
LVDSASVSAISDGAVATEPDERISAVDVLRGVAVLGILIINIDYFALPHSDKSAAGTEWIGAYWPAGLSPRAMVAWVAVRALFEGKMRAIFSMLFGASALLMTSRLERRGEAGRAADIYYRRTLWLLVFGILHAYLLWEGDILYSYAVGGLVLFPFRKLSGRALVVLGLALLSLSVPRAAWIAHHRADLRAAAARADADEAAGLTLGRKQQDAQAEWAEVMESFAPDEETLRENVDAYRGSYARLFAHRAPVVIAVQSSDFYGYAFIDAVGMMMIGMGLLRLGILTGARSRRFYATLAVLGLGLGVPAAVASTRALELDKFDPVAVAWVTAVYDPTRLAVALGHIGIVMLLARASWARWLTRSLADVGRMALTSYLGASIICSTLFNGYGFGLFGVLDRPQLYLVTLAIWFAQLAFSRIWLRAFRFGPAEWLWRSLTYWKRQPLRRTHAATAAMI